MKLSEMMTRGVEVTEPDANVASAAKTMRDLNIGFLPVSSGDQLVGVLTDRDIVTRVAALGLDPTLALVSEAMTRDVVTCLEDQSAEEAARLMQTRQIRRLPIVDHNQRLVGVVSLGDLAVDALKQGDAGETLRSVSWPAEPEG